MHVKYNSNTFILKAALQKLKLKIVNVNNCWQDDQESEFSFIEEKGQKTGHTWVEKSPFGRLFKGKYKDMTKLACSHGDENPYYLPQFPKSLLVFFMPFAPLWTGLMLGNDEDKVRRKRFGKAIY